MDPVVHFEMPYDDSDRLAEFYKAVFGWRMSMLGEQMGHYMLAGTSDSGPDGTPTKAGMINGGFFRRSADMPDQYPSVVVAVKDIGRSMDAVRDAGGEVLGDPMDLPGVGQYVSFRDSEGNRVGMLQPLPMDKPKAAKKPAASKPAPKKSAAKAPAKKPKKARK